MPNLSIKDVPDAWAEALRQRAARNHRSLQGELMAMVEQAVQGSAGVGESRAAFPHAAAQHASEEQPVPRVVGYDKRGWPIVRQGWKRPEEVIAELRAKYPEPIAGQPLAMDLIRQDRDSR